MLCVYACARLGDGRRKNTQASKGGMMCCRYSLIDERYCERYYLEFTVVCATNSNSFPGRKVLARAIGTARRVSYSFYACRYRWSLVLRYSGGDRESPPAIRELTSGNVPGESPRGNGPGNGPGNCPRGKGQSRRRVGEYPKRVSGWRPGRIGFQGVRARPKRLSCKKGGWEMNQTEWVVLLIEVGIIAVAYLFTLLGLGRRVP
jgi:hypothetical protein